MLVNLWLFNPVLGMDDAGPDFGARDCLSEQDLHESFEIKRNQRP